ncbi:MOSC domain-containing protein [Variovorax sp. VNK109]|uniref:MOSC domain-containing protein n=1 Tax=Variovorax sp. VNK109 TaxID=3400919 RepID=UPI003C0CD82B
MNIAALYRFPIKGLSAESLPQVGLRAGFGFPMDRVYAVTDGSLDFDEAIPKPAPKTQFLMLAKYERLARLKTRYVDADNLMVVEEAGLPAKQFRLDVHEDREAFAAFLGGYVGMPLPGKPRLVRAEGHQFTDVSVHGVELMRSISLINLATVRDLSEKLGAVLDPVRFRGNLVFDGAPAWSELDWVGRTLHVGDVKLRIIRRTKRCAATSVNPQTAIRDVNVPLGIRDKQGHGDLGVYAEVVTPGTIAAGDAMVLQEA